MPEKVTSLNRLKVTLEYGSYNICQNAVKMSNHWLVRNVLMLKSPLSAVSSTGRCNAILNQGGRCHETKNSD